LRFDFRDLAAAARDSCSDSHSCGFDLLEGPSVSVEGRLSAGELLPALNDHIAIFRIELDPEANALG
jgi:hypothetical protein